MMHHSVKRNASAVEKYFHEIKEGKIYPPIYKHDFDVLKRDHDIP